MAVINLNLFSMMLRFGTDVTVVLPDEIQKDEKLACVWLYHGGSGDHTCLLYTSDAADEEDSEDIGGCRIIEKKKRHCFFCV